MLADHERKLLRVLSSYTTARKRIPSIGLLGIKTGRQVHDLERSLGMLSDEGFITWSKEAHHELIILKHWENDGNVKAEREPVVQEFWMWESF